jgi:hypothetical protein
MSQHNQEDNIHQRYKRNLGPTKTPQGKDQIHLYSTSNTIGANRELTPPSTHKKNNGVKSVYQRTTSKTGNGPFPSDPQP